MKLIPQLGHSDFFCCCCFFVCFLNVLSFTLRSVLNTVLHTNIVVQSKPLLSTAGEGNTYFLIPIEWNHLLLKFSLFFSKLFLKVFTGWLAGWLALFMNEHLTHLHKYDYYSLHVLPLNLDVSSVIQWHDTNSRSDSVFFLFSSLVVFLCHFLIRECPFGHRKDTFLILWPVVNFKYSIH